MSSLAQRIGSDGTGQCTRSDSSIASVQRLGSASTAASWSGWASSSRTVWSISETVVWLPPPISRSSMSTSSCSPSGASSSTRAASRKLVRSSAGSRRLRSMSVRMATFMSVKTAADSSSGTLSVLSTTRRIRSTSGRRSSGTPNRSQIIRVGSCCEYAVCRSIGSSAGRAARSSSSSRRDRLQVRAHRVDPLGRQRGRDELAQPLVLATLRGGHRLDVHPRRQPLHLAGLVARHVLLDVARHSRVRQQLPHDVASGDRPGGEALRQLDRNGGALRAQLVELLRTCIGHPCCRSECRGRC